MRVLVLVALALGLAAPAAVADGFRIQADAIYFDLDGTALDHDGHVPAATVAAVKRFRECGGKVGIATGRTLDQAREAMAALEPELPVVIYNGGAAVAPASGDYLFLEPLPLSVVSRTIAALRGRAGMLGADVYERDAAFEGFGGDSTARFPHHTGVRSAGRWPDRPVATQHTVLKVLAFARPESAAAVRDELAKRLGRSAHVIRSGPSTIEIVPPGVNKAAAIRRALAMVREHPARIVAFGDSGNDVEMLREFSLGIAMGNCLDEACRAAMARIGDHDSDAIARTLDDVLVGPKCWDEHRDAPH